jgi:hypothetical protein
VPQDRPYLDESLHRGVLSLQQAVFVLAAACRKFTDNDKVSGASQEMHPLKELAETEQVGLEDPFSVCLLSQPLQFLWTQCWRTGTDGQTFCCVVVCCAQVAAALEFFLRPENDFITGQVLAVDGGLSTLHPHRAQEYGV